jgi:hypothetical protein
MMDQGLTFFCELDGKGLKKLFENRFVYDDLKTINASVTMALVDFSNERAEIVKKLNKLGIPVKVWLLLPEEDGFNLTIANHTKALQRYADLKAWTAKHELLWHGIGLDIEPQFNQLTDSNSVGLRAIKNTWRRYLHKNLLKQASLGYRKLAVQIHDDGYSIETYHFPYILEGQNATPGFNHGLGGMVDVPVDREVLMLYSSMFQENRSSLMWSYAENAQAIGIGITAKSKLITPLQDPETLTWEEFTIDLLLAKQHCKAVYVFNLEGCVEQGFLPRLVTFNWNNEVRKPKTVAIKQARKGFSLFLWIFERPLIFMARVVGFISGLTGLDKKKK